MSTYTEDQLQEVISWMEDEDRSVTIATVSQSLEISRSQAQALLEQLAERNGASTFRVTVVPSEENTTGSPIPTTVFKLSQSSHAKDGYIYAVTEKESLATAHERDMDQMREMLKNNQLSNLTASATDVILPAEQVIPMMGHNAQSSDRPIVSSLDRSKATAPAKKVTTAESFFQKKSATVEKLKSTKAKDATKEQPKESKTGHSFSKKPKGMETSKENEKENQAKTSKVGCVDDFMGDEDDSDDDPMEVDVAPRKKIIRGRKQSNKEEKVEEPVSEEEPVLPVRGAMDDFATEAKQRPAAETSTSGRRRRKKLVQKTSMDAQGYLHTETQEIWEDIPSDEEDEPIFIPKKPTTTQQTSTKKVAMKQGSLLGFFTKK